MTNTQNIILKILANFPKLDKDVNQFHQNCWDGLIDLSKNITELHDIFISSSDKSDCNFKDTFLLNAITLSMSNITTLVQNSNINAWIIRSAMLLSIRKQIELNLMLTSLLYVKDGCLDSRLKKILESQKYTFNCDEMNIDEETKKIYFSDNLDNKNFINTNKQIEFCSLFWSKDILKDKNIDLMYKATLELFNDSSNMIHNSAFFKYFNTDKQKNEYIIEGKIQWDIGKAIHSIPWNTNTITKKYNLDWLGNMLITLLSKDLHSMYQIQTITMMLIKKLLNKFDKK